MHVLRRVHTFVWFYIAGVCELARRLVLVGLFLLLTECQVWFSLHTAAYFKSSLQLILL